MKSDERHHLHQHELQRVALQAKPWFEKHGWQVLGGVVAALVLLAIGITLVASQSATKSAGWDASVNARTIDDFGVIADKHGDSLPGLWARLQMAEMNLETGVVDMFTDRAAALKTLTRAQSDFETVLASKLTAPPAVRERALLGLARVLEATCDGDATKAIAAYQRLIEEFPQSPYKPMAEQRVKELPTGNAREFYAWFHKQQPKPVDFKKPADGPKPGLTLPGGMDLPLPPGPTAPPEKSDAPKTEPAKADATNPEAAAGDASKTESSKTELPKTDATKVDVPPANAAKTDAPKTDAPAEPK